MITTFGEAVGFVERHIPSPDKKHPGKLGLERMTYFMELLGNPQREYPTIHVAGTSGKGSTSTIIASILGTKGTVGLYTSPHLERINERISIFCANQFEIGERDFVETVKLLHPSIVKVSKSRYGTLTYFEILAGMAFAYFKHKQVEFAVIEVGMGGKYDATNVILPEVAVITNIGLDHTEVLGNTVEEIADEKLGIIKPHGSVIHGINQPSIIQKIELLSGQNKARLFSLNRDFDFTVRDITERGSTFNYQSKENNFQNLKLSLLGRHQITNAALAIKAVEALSYCAPGDKEALEIPDNDIRLVLSSVFVPGRMEIIRHDPIIMLDGAHNGDKARALKEAITEIYTDKRVITVLAIKNGKHVKDVLSQLLPVSAEIILTSFHVPTDLGDTRSYPPHYICRVISKMKIKTPVFVQENPVQALALAKQRAKKDDVILITGSLYLVGEIRKSLVISR